MFSFFSGTCWNSYIEEIVNLSSNGSSLVETRLNKFIEIELKRVQYIEYP